MSLEGAVEIPREGESAVFVVLEALEFLDEVNFEFGADPHAEFKGDVFVGECAAIPARAGFQADGVGLFHPILDADLVAVQARLTFNCGEFAIIKTGVVDGFPNAKKFDGVTVAQPVRDEEISILRFQHVGQRNEVLVFGGEDGDGSPLDFDGGFLGLAHGVIAVASNLATGRGQFTSVVGWSANWATGGCPIAEKFPVVAGEIGMFFGIGLFMRQASD